MRDQWDEEDLRASWFAFGKKMAVFTLGDDFHRVTLGCQPV
jgi:hypothetical protein